VALGDGKGCVSACETRKTDVTDGRALSPLPVLKEYTHGALDFLRFRVERQPLQGFGTASGASVTSKLCPRRTLWIASLRCALAWHQEDGFSRSFVVANLDLVIAKDEHVRLPAKAWQNRGF
jgi:hypothetical protein